MVQCAAMEGAIPVFAFQKCGQIAQELEMARRDDIPNAAFQQISAQIVVWKAWSVDYFDLGFLFSRPNRFVGKFKILQLLLGSSK